MEVRQTNTGRLEVRTLRWLGITLLILIFVLGVMLTSFEV